MPSKDIEKRRFAYRKWASNHKEQRKNYQRIQRIAKKANPVPQKCLVRRKHHKRIYHVGKCSICGNKVLARGYCNKHYKSERKKIDPEYVRMEKVRRERSRKRILAPSI